MYSDVLFFSDFLYNILPLGVSKSIVTSLGIPEVNTIKP